MIAPDDPRHGTNAGHVAGCREQCCNVAKTRYDKRRKYEIAATGQSRRVPSVGYERRLRALQSLGWSYARLAPKLGCNTSTLHERTNATTVSRANYERMVDLYNQLSMVTPLGLHVQRDRRRAAAKGWVPPLAWDDETIDDPEGQPYRGRTRGANPELGLVDQVVVERALAGERIHANPAERAEVVRRWTSAGRSVNDLERFQGWNIRRDQRAA